MSVTLAFEVLQHSVRKFAWYYCLETTLRSSASSVFKGLIFFQDKDVESGTFRKHCPLAAMPLFHSPFQFLPPVILVDTQSMASHQAPFHDIKLLRKWVGLTKVHQSFVSHSVCLFCIFSLPCFNPSFCSLIHCSIPLPLFFISPLVYFLWIIASFLSTLPHSLLLFRGGGGRGGGGALRDTPDASKACWKFERPESQGQRVEADCASRWLWMVRHYWKVAWNVLDQRI